MGEHTFDRFYEKASAEVGLQVGLLKAISKVESDFNAYFKTIHEPRKFGVMGLTLQTASLAPQEKFGAIQISDLMDPESNIRIAAYVLRLCFHILPNPSMMDVIAKYGEMNSSHGGDYIRKVWEAYWHYSQLPGEPTSTMPSEVEGVDVRRPERQGDIFI